jgi:hypothetical protein
MVTTETAIITNQPSLPNSPKHWQDAEGRHVVGHANLASGLEAPNRENLPPDARAAITAPAPRAAGPTQIWHKWNDTSLPPAHPNGEMFWLTFGNRRFKPIKICWLSPAGEHKYYYEIPPAGTVRQKVRKDAVWLATDSADALLGYFQIRVGASLAVIPE